MTEFKEFKLPDVGEGLTEADIVAWHVKPGDQVEVNQIIVEIETAKAVVELPSPWDGTVARLLVEEGQTVDVGTPIIAVEVPSAGSAVAGKNDSAERSVVPAPATADRPRPVRPPRPPRQRPNQQSRASPISPNGRRSWSATGSRPRPPRAGRASPPRPPRPPRQRPGQQQRPSQQSRPNQQSNQHSSGRWPSRRSAGWPRISASTWPS